MRQSDQYHPHPPPYGKVSWHDAVIRGVASSSSSSPDCTFKFQKILVCTDAAILAGAEMISRNLSALGFWLVGSAHSDRAGWIEFIKIVSYLLNIQFTANILSARTKHVSVWEKYCKKNIPQMGHFKDAWHVKSVWIFQLFLEIERGQHNAITSHWGQKTSSQFWLCSKEEDRCAQPQLQES